MEDLSLTHLQQQIQALEKQNRILQKKLARSEANRAELEHSYEIQNTLVTQTIQRLEKSRVEAEQRRQELQEAFNNLQIMQAKLIESEKMSALGILVAGIAHEINNPINFIHANIDYAQTYVQDLLTLLKLYQTLYPQPDHRITSLMEEKEMEFVIQDICQLLNSMQVGSDRIRNIVLGLRTFSRIDEAGCKHTDLHDGLESSLMILQHRLNAKDNRPAIDVIRNYGVLPPISCFAGQLNQVFLNILTNAIDAIEEQTARLSLSQKHCYSGCITIHTSIVMRESNWVRITISDNGVGMIEEVQRKIFDPFFTTKPVGSGTGLGMSVSYKIIVENHQGKLDCYSMPGVGSEVLIHIPFQPTNDHVMEFLTPENGIPKTMSSIDKKHCIQVDSNIENSCPIEINKGIN